MAAIPYALQLFSVRDALSADPAATLARVKEIGYDHVELASLSGMTATAFRSALDSAGLGCASCHVEFSACKQDIASAIGDCKTLGVSWAVIPWLSREDNPSAADWVARAEEMAGFGQSFKDEGITLCYHNHHHEFDAIDGKNPFDIVFETASPDFLKVELDVGWAHYGGVDPMVLMKAHAGRIPLIHLKDIKQRYEGEDPVITELGNGVTKLAPIMKIAGEIGVQWLIVEQDEAKRDPLESARMNAAYMRVHSF